MDVRERVVQPVGQAGEFTGKVIVVAGQDGELSDGLLVGGDPWKGVRQRAGGVGDDEGVTGIGLGLTGVQVREPARRQPGEVGNDDAHAPGHRDRQRAMSSSNCSIAAA